MTTNNGRFAHVAAGDGPAYSLIGEVITFKITGAETGDTLSVAEVVSPPGGGPPLHTHPAAELFIIQEGAFEFSGLDRGGVYTIRAMPGDTVYIPGGAPHGYKTVSPTPGRAFGVLTPGGAMERFFAEVGTPVSDRSAATAPAGPPSAEEIARHMTIAKRYGIVFLQPEGATAVPQG